MKLKKIYINAIGGIQELELNFNPYMNIICGPNGIGKTTILECIAQTFTYNSHSFVRKKADRPYGMWVLTNDNNQSFEVRKINFHPEDMMAPQFTQQPPSPSNIIFIKTNRYFDYVPLTSISKDNADLDRQYKDANLLISGLQISDAKNWFIHRHLWSAHDNSLTQEQRHNFEVAKTIFGKLDDSFSFSKVKASSYDILLRQTDGSEIYFEYLSSGYKSVVFILLGLIKELELRFDNPGIKVDDFSGIVLIDELDLHLHPKWQSQILKVLREIFPNVQFIASTHSAHIIQSANSDEIIPLVRDENGNVNKRELASNRFGYKGWTLEEVLKDVMGLEDTRSIEFNEALNTFEYAIDQENLIIAKENYAILQEMLHPTNHIRKLLKLQLATLGERIDD